MALVDLITLNRAKIAFPNLLDDTQDGTIATLVTAASRAIERYCRRVFASTAFDEIYDTDATGSLLLRHFPITAVSRVALQPVTVLQVQNTTSTSSVSRCTVATTLASGADWESPATAASTGLVLTRTQSGVTTTDATLTWAGNVTVQAVADTVNALGNGWKATAQGGCGHWPSADINPIQGALSALQQGAQLTIHTTDLTAYDLVPDTGELRFSGNIASAVYSAGWLPGSYAFDILPGVSLPRGGRNCRIQYTAGFTGLPIDVGQQTPLAEVAHACAILTAHFFSHASSVGNLKSETLGDYTYSRDEVQGWPHNVRQLLAAWRDHRV